MKTEVVLKYFTVLGMIASSTFNENRSCIEICSKRGVAINSLGLMKTEVVLK